MKATDTKRKVRAYKATDKVYKKAVKKSKKHNAYLATIIEAFLIDFGNGHQDGYAINCSNNPING